MKYQNILSPIKIGSCELKNRVVMPPMHLGLANLDGTLSERFMDYYEERAKGGVGLIISEIVRVNDFHGATSFMQPALSHDYHIQGWAELSKRIKRHGVKIFAQLQHPGRQNLGIMINTLPISVAATRIFKHFPDLLFKVAPKLNKTLNDKGLTFSSVAPSKCEMSAHADSRVRPLSNKEIKKTITQFINAGKRAKKAGLDGIEIHAAHGYLVNQFLSPNTNFRTDEYGGSFENRLRFLKEIVEGIKAECGNNFPVIVRLTVDEFYDKIGYPDKGYNIELGVKYAKAIEDMGVDAIDVSSANYDTYNYWLEPTSFNCGWRAYLSEAVKKEVSIPVMAANLIRSADQAEEQIKHNIQDLVSLGRPHIADPYWTAKISTGREDEIKRCINCLNCMESTFNGAFSGKHGVCAVNPTIGREKKHLDLVKDGDNRTVVIIGAGVAGLTCAEILARRNFNVVILEKESRIGGQILLAKQPPGKGKIGWVVDDLISVVKKLGVRIFTSTEGDIDTIRSFSPYSVVIATGAYATVPNFLKDVSEQIYTTTDILNKSVTLSDQTIALVGSGMTGLETAEMLCQANNAVHIIELADQVAPTAWHQLKDDVLRKLEKHNVRILTSTKFKGVTNSGVLLENNKEKRELELKCDSIVLSMGSTSRNELLPIIKENFKNIFVIGDANEVGNIASATTSAYNVAAFEIN